MSNFNEISDFVLKGKAKDCAAAVEAALKGGTDPLEVLNKGLVAGMNAVGDKFKNGEVFVPEVLVSARAMNKGVEILKPALQKAGVQPVGKAVICTIQGDLHDIGKNLVKIMVEGKGIEVTDLGADVQVSKIIDAAKSTNAKVVLLSAMLTTTMPYMKDVVDGLRAAGIKDKVKVMCGGTPISKAFVEEIGADGYAVDASSAADLCRSYY